MLQSAPIAHVHQPCLPGNARVSAHGVAHRSARYQSWRRACVGPAHGPSTMQGHTSSPPSCRPAARPAGWRPSRRRQPPPNRRVIAAGYHRSAPPCVKFGSVPWVNFQSTPTSFNARAKKADAFFMHLNISLRLAVSLLQLADTLLLRRQRLNNAGLAILFCAAWSIQHPIAVVPMSIVWLTCCNHTPTFAGVRPRSAFKSKMQHGF